MKYYGAPSKTEYPNSTTGDLFYHPHVIIIKELDTVQIHDLWEFLPSDSLLPRTPGGIITRRYMQNTLFNQLAWILLIYRYRAEFQFIKLEFWIIFLFLEHTQNNIGLWPIGLLKFNLDII